MQRTRITFEVVKLITRKSGYCKKCGKYMSRSKTFDQTVNPFNKLPDGTIKTRDDVFQELLNESKQWKGIPVIHQKCECLPIGFC
jgi:TIP49-like protein